MNVKIERLLANAARRKSGPKSERLLVALKRGPAYRRCIGRLKASGVMPIKTNDVHRLICCHADKRTGRARLRNHPDVAYVERDAGVKAHDCGCRAGIRAIVVPWNVRRVKAAPVWSRTRGSGVRVAVLDTGIARHPDLKIAGGVNTLGGRSFADDNGHGTHIAGILAATGRRRLTGVAPAVRLYAVKVLDAAGNGFVSDIIEGIDWSLKRGIRVLNMSFGTSADSLALRNAIRRARRKGAVVVASAGNEGPLNRRLDAPARYPETIAAAASTRANRAASFSSRGRNIAVAAPGVNILSTLPGGKYGRMSGTSMSAPHVAGGAALLRALSPKLSPASVAKRLKAAALPIPGGKRSAGSGLLRIAPAAAGLGTKTRT
ncbi:S8 family peptidase [Cohnella caldifontis]|uniref:S8 family peptidase n=1 Tax=Cohnella caldifontis TaxID=3027471 RepID=UPI0023EB6D7B|nr:S8 family peptidase [Cohnella sp. YIM B05605]